MLFSNDQIAAFVNRSFEPVWESVRPVPIIRIDFGNGHVVTRTLHGNIASYVCAADGQVLDVLPGIYNAAGYTDALDQLRILHTNLNLAGKGRDAALATYHKQQAEALKKGENPARLVDLLKIAPVGKMIVERRLERFVGNPTREALAGAVPQPAPRFDTANDVAGWKALEEDTRLNEKARRQLIHEMLAQKGNVKPEAISKWLYKEVLHADLDDPYLGLGDALFAGYPFTKEEKK